MTTPRFKSDAFEAIHSSASALHRVGAIDKATMRDFDEASLIKPTETVEKVGHGPSACFSYQVG